MSDDGVMMQSCRVATTRKFLLLDVHVDGQNDNDDPVFSPVLVLSRLVKVNGVSQRMAFITYSRKFVSETLAKINRYSKALEHLSFFYNRIVAQGRIQLNSNIFQQDFKKLNFDSPLAARIPTNLDTCLHWSAMGSDGILKIK